jgi:hypothetical protein
MTTPDFTLPPVLSSDIFWFYGRRLDRWMTAAELDISNRYYAACLDALGGMAGEW